MYRYLKITVVILSLQIQTAGAQSAPPEVDLVHPNHGELERFTFLSVNSLRKERGEADLIWNDVLYRAAKDHANYLIGEKKISHFQTIRGKQTPNQRVKLHGGVSFTSTGENIVEVVLGVQWLSSGKIRSTVTYASAGASMADLWKNSPGHYKNIISKSFNCAALATAYDSATRRLVAVQVFGYSSAPGSQNSIPDYAASVIISSSPKLPHGLKGYRQKAKHQKAINAFLKMKADRGYLTGSYKSAKKIFKGTRSGIVQEFIPLQQFDSASAEFLSVPNRRNGQYELNGQLDNPAVYRKALLKYAKQHTARSYLIDTKFLRIKRPPTQFIYPLYPNSHETESNVFLVMNKHMVVFKSYLNVPSGLFEIPFPELEYKNSFKPLAEKERFKYHHQYDTSTLTIFYSPEEVILDNEQQQEVRKAFNGRGKIVSIEAAAFASIEGNKTTNDRFAKDRMDYFMVLAKPFLDTVTVYPQIDTREQWELFYTQIKGTRLDNLGKMDVNEVRKFVNHNKKDTLIARLLNEQRYTHIKLVWRQDFKEQLPSKSPLHQYDSLKSRVKQIEKPKAQLVNALEKAQLAVYDALSQSGDVTTGHLPDVSGLQQYPAFKYHDLVFRYTVLKNVSSKVFYDSLHMFAASNNFPRALRDQLVYNNLALIYKNYINGTLPDLMDCGNLDCSRYRQSQFHLKKFKKLKCAKKHDDLTKRDQDYYVLKEIPALIRMGSREQVNTFPAPELWKYYYLGIINTLYPTIPIDQEIYSVLPDFKKHFHPDDTKLTDEERLKLAYLYCALHRYEIAKELIEPLASRASPNIEALKLHISLVAWELKGSEITELLIREYPRLGKSEWCDMIVHPSYLNFLLLEDLRLKQFYNCNCGR